MVLALLKPHTLFHLGDLSVDADAVALAIESFELFAELTLAAADHWSQDGDTLLR